MTYLNKTINIEADRIGPKLKVCWMPAVPGPEFAIECNSFADAYVLLDTLAHYDIFLEQNKLVGGHANTGWLMSQDDSGEWIEWEGEDGETIDNLSHEDCIHLDRDFYNGELMSAAGYHE